VALVRAVRAISAVRAIIRANRSIITVEDLADSVTTLKKS
jgi:hypothetical protein